jgi:hypothetical protein
MYMTDAMEQTAVKMTALEPVLRLREGAVNEPVVPMNDRIGSTRTL